MNKIRFFLMIAFAVSALVSFNAFGADSLAFQSAVAFSVLNAVAPFLPKFDLSGYGDGLHGADPDPAEVLASLVKDLGETRADLKKQQDELKSAHTEVMKSVTDATKLDKEVRDNIDKAIAKANETGEVVNELTQKIDALQKSVVDGNGRAPLSLRKEMSKQLEVNKDKYEALKNGESKSFKLTMKEITSTEAAGLLRDPFRDTLVSFERRPLRIRDLLTVIPVQSDSVKYAKQSVRTNAARIVAEGTKKPYSQYAWIDATATIETIAHLAKMTLQAIADAPRLVAEVESEMRFGLAFAEEQEILMGDGSSGHLSGLVDNATAYAVPAGVNTANILTDVDKLRIAILQIHLQYAAPDGHVLNPIDMANIELLRRDPDKGGGYLFGNPDAGGEIARLWRLPVVESASMPVGDFLTGAFKYAASLYDRSGVSVLISTENDTDFEDNKATMRCESRLGLAVRRPFALVTGEFGSGS